MARPVRIDVADGWYHVTARGIERREIYLDRRDHEHFLDLLGDMAQRYEVRIHAYCLMGNHYHLLIQTPQANASAAVQWLNVSYSVWFNRRRERVGHVFQGRFSSTLVDGEGAWALSASVYVHLNPVRTQSHGLGKAANRAEGAGVVPVDRASVKQRLKTLRNYRWSSYRAYGGYGSAPAWLSTSELLKRAGGARAYRRYVQQHVTRGMDPEGIEGLGQRVVLGSRQFLETARAWVGSLSKEQPARRQMASRVSVAQIVSLVERKRNEPWAEFVDRHGDWGRELVLYLARKRTGRTLRQIGEELGIAEYKTVGRAVQRFERSLAVDPERERMTSECLDELSLVET